MNKVVKDIIKDKKTCYFVSPHLDDAAFSAGGLISYLAKKTEVVVITVFTEARADKHSLSAIAYAKKCGFDVSEMKKFFALRKKEDKKLFESLGVSPIHLGFYDALWRKKKNINLIEKLLSCFLKDFRYIYPTHRLHVGKGKIFKDDLINLEKLQKRLKEVIGIGKNVYVFCPLGLGNHVDHIMVKTACTNTFVNVLYWEDAPYNLYNKVDKRLIIKNGLNSVIFNKNQDERKSMYPAYKTQFGKLFGGRTVFDIPPETYYLRESKVYNSIQENSDLIEDELNADVSSSFRGDERKPRLLRRGGCQKKNTRRVRKPTVIVGIPAYDEEANIGELLKALFRQKQDNFDLKEIIVVSDGSKDKTELIVESFKDKKIKLLKNECRLGQNKSQNLIISMTSSDYLLLLEADTLPSDKYFISKMVEHAEEKNAGVVQGLPRPLKPRNFVESVLIKQGILFSEFYLGKKNAVQMHISGQGGRLISNEVFKKLFWPKYVYEDLYLLFFCKQKSEKYLLNEDAICYCRYPDNIRDYLRKRRKVMVGHLAMMKYFSKENPSLLNKVAYKETLIMFFKFLAEDPLRFFVYIFIKIYSKLKMRGTISLQPYYYARSTKILIRYS
jgi:glycosyltransferase involved in cell wall biosynthesis/LmbE family N-acetylglucosaminyl deacetylase